MTTVCVYGFQSVLFGDVLTKFLAWIVGFKILIVGRPRCQRFKAFMTYNKNIPLICPCITLFQRQWGDNFLMAIAPRLIAACLIGLSLCHMTRLRHWSVTNISCCQMPHMMDSCFNQSLTITIINYSRRASKLGGGLNAFDGWWSSLSYCERSPISSQVDNVFRQIFFYLELEKNSEGSTVVFGDTQISYSVEQEKGSSCAKNQLDSFSRFDRTPTSDRQIQGHCSTHASIVSCAQKLNSKI